MGTLGRYDIAVPGILVHGLSLFLLGPVEGWNGWVVARAYVQLCRPCLVISYKCFYQFTLHQSI